MGTIATGVGLASGLNIAEIVDALIAAQKGTVNRLTQRGAGLQQTKTGLDTLSATILTLKTSATSLKDAGTFDKRFVTVSDPDQLAVTPAKGAALGTLQFQALRKATAQQVVSKGFADATTQKIGTGTITISKGGSLDSNTRLDMLNGGKGVSPGQFRITDRSGRGAIIDLRSAVTVDDVLHAINSNAEISVTAKAERNGIVLTDTSGQTFSNLIVTDLAGGSTAADLGIRQSVAADTLVGSDVFEITGDFKLTQINDGNGLKLTTGAPDIRITLTDDPTTTIEVNLDGAVTLNDVIQKINDHEDNNGKLSASIVDGRIVLNDLTGGGGTGTLAVTDINGSSAVKQLGLNASAAGDTLTGNRLGAGINSVLLRNLRSGQGIDSLGEITLTDRTGATATIDLSNAETLDEVIAAINSAESAGSVKLQLTASLNAAGNGIQIVDTSGATASNLIIADEAGSTLAAQLGIAVDAAQTSVNSGSLHLQHVNEATSLADYARGGKFTPGTFRITDSQGNESVINVTSAVKTVGDLIQRINLATGAQVTARLNETGDGIELVDEAGGAGQLSVAELGGNTAENLRLLGTGTTGSDGKSHLVGRTATIITVEEGDTLDSLVTKLNKAEAGITASTLNNGASINPLRLSLVSKNSGLAGALVIDDGGLGLGLATQVEAQDAVLRVGDLETGYLLTSSSNRFENPVPGVTVDILKTSSAAADVQISQDVSSVTQVLSGFVTAYNKLLSSSAELTKYDSATGQRGLLQGNSVVLNVLSRFDRVISSNYGAEGSGIRNVFELGIRIELGGKLSFDSSKFETVLKNNPDAVREFFSKATTGLGAQLSESIDDFTDPFEGNLTVQSKSIDSSLESLASRIETLNEMLEVKRDRLMKQFIAMEQAIASLNSQQTVLSQIRSLVPASSQSNK